MTLYNFAAIDIHGEVLSFDRYAGNLVLIVNTASHCGFTPQYEGLENLYQKYKDQGLIILAFPCNQFAGQEPGDELAIKRECITKYAITFPVFSKVDVNGKDAIALFKWLKWSQPGFLSNMIKWNFTKFVIDREGKAVKRFSPLKTAETIEMFLLENNYLN